MEVLLRLTLWVKGHEEIRRVGSSGSSGPYEVDPDLKLLSARRRGGDPGLGRRPLPKGPRGRNGRRRLIL